MTISAESCNFCLRYASSSARKVHGCVLRLTPLWTLTLQTRILNTKKKIKNQFSILECHQNIARLHRHNHRSSHTHPAPLICLLTTPFYLTDRVLVFGLAPIQSVCTLWRSPQSTNFIPSQSFRPFIYIKERRSCSFTLICLSACYFHSARRSFGGVRFKTSSRYFSLDFLPWLL